MPLLEWKDEYLLGIAGLDFEHEDLFECLNALYDECIGTVGSDLLLLAAIAGVGSRWRNLVACERLRPSPAIQAPMNLDIGVSGSHLHPAGERQQ